MTNADTPRPEAAPAPAPGRMLREARERMSLGQHAVADALHLRLAVVDALENDRYDELPPTTFTKGYLKVYAKLVHVDEDEVLAAFQRHLDESGESERASLGTPRRPAGSGGGRRALLLAIPLVLLVAVVVWGAWDYLSEADDAASNPPAAERSMPTDDDLGSEPAPTEQPPRSNEIDNAVAALEEPIVAEPPPPLPAAALGEEEPVAATVVEEPAQPIVSEPSAPPALTLHLAEESWIEVRDAGGNNVLVGTLRGPETYEVSAPAPYAVVIGHAAAVELTFDGEPVDLAPYTRGRVARLTLGGE